MKKPKIIRCPYCGGTAILRDASFVYGTHSHDQLEAAYNIYREQFISCDFIRRSMERLEERIGLCNLPYETLRDDPSLLHEAYLQFLRLEDCNVAYNDTLEQVIDAIEQWLASGTLSPVNLTVSNQNMGETFGTEVDV